MENISATLVDNTGTRNRRGEAPGRSGQTGRCESRCVPHSASPTGISKTKTQSQHELLIHPRKKLSSEITEKITQKGVTTIKPMLSTECDLGCIYSKGILFSNPFLF